MRRLHVAALFGIILTLALLVWNGIGRRNDAVGSPVRATQAAAPSRDFGAVPVNTVSAAPSAYVAPRNAGDLPAAREKQRIFAKAKVLKERATPPDGQGRFTKTRLVEAEGKYPFLRVEEVWQKGAAGEEVLVDEKAMVADHFVVRVREKTARTELETFLTGFGGSIRRAIPNSDLYLVKTPAVSLDVYELTLARLRQAGPLLKYAEPDYVVHALMTPNDPSFGLLWGLHNVGQTSGTGDADIDAPEAWDVTRGSAAVVVGIIDTGIDYTHPDLAANSWVNTAEIPGNGIDDDGNGYVDDVRGWDFVNNDNDPMDDHYHGTHCAGTIGAVGNNGIGVVGVCHTVKLMALKFLSSSGSGYNSDAVEAVSYATANGATLTSNSWGGGGYSQALKDAIDAAGAAGKLFVAAAGNNSQDTDSVAFYPSCYNSPNIIAVAATDHNDALASFSNYGATTVHLGAPGVSIYSTSPQSGYRTLSGTSMATPHVAGACALLKSARPVMSWSDIKNALLENADGVASLAGKTRSGGRLNIARAVLISAGPYVALTGVQVLEPGGDGIINPGDAVSLPITIKNVGGEAAAGLSTTATLVAGAPPVTMVQATQNWGALASGASASNTATPFALTIAAAVPTPHKFTVRFTTTDDQGRSWVSDSEFTIYTSATVSGRVTALTGGAGIAGATVSYSGAASGTATTNASGNYSVALLDGTYSFAVTAPGYNPPAAVSVTTPPGRSDVDFALGRSQLQVSPASLAVTQNEDQITQTNLTVTNTGDQPLTVNIGASNGAAGFSAAAGPVRSPDALANLGPAGAAEHSAAAPPVPDASVANTTLPFYDGFESGSLTGWSVGSGNGTREITGGLAAVGTKSFHQIYTGSPDHFTGISRPFAANTRPKSVSFWVRPASTTTAAGYCVLTGGGGDFIWFFADDTGKFYVNGDLAGGDQSFSYQANVWYRVEFRNVNWTLKTFDYFVNGALVKAGVPFRNAWVAAMDTFYLYNLSTNSEAWWDDVRVLDTTVDWLDCSPAQLTLAPGQSVTVQVTFNSTDLVAGSYSASLDLLSNDPLNPTTSVPVSFTVNPAPNTPPVANSQTVTTVEDTSAGVTLSGSDADGNPLTAQITTLPAGGTLYQTSDGTSLGVAITAVPAVVTHPLWKVIFVPAPNANGTPLATFQFQLKDKRSASNTATVTLNVTPVNDVPVAQNDYASALPGQSPLTIAVLANDSDAEGQPLTITAVTQGARGAVAINGDGTVSYTPQGTFTQGNDAFTYTVSDGAGGIATATVSVSIGYLAAGAWPTLGNGPKHNGYYGASLGTQTFAPNWTLAFDRPLNQAAIAEGKVFVTRDLYFHDATLTAVDLPTGTIVWSKVLPIARSTTPPSYYQGQIYFQRGNSGSDSQLWNVSATDGATIWSAPFAAQWEVYQAPAVTDSSVFINGGYYGGMYGFTRGSGAQLFFHELPQVDGWTPTVGGTAVYSCVNGYLISHDPTTGARNWTHTLNSGLYGANVPAYAGNRLYAATATGLYAVDVSGATPVRSWTATNANGFTGIPAVANLRVYAIASSGSTVQQFDTNTGAALGDFLTGTENCIHQPIVTNDCLIVASVNQTFIFRLSDRALLQTIPFGGYPSISNGVLILAGLDSILRSYVISGGGNTPPVATAQTATCTEDSTVTITLGGTDADGDLLSAIIDTLPAIGTLYQTSDGVQVGAPITVAPVLVSNPGRKVIYRPPPDAFGTALTSFNFRVNDGTVNSAGAVVTVNVTNVNDPPTAVNDQFYLRAGSTLLAFWPTANDIDPDGETLTIVSFTQPAHGTVTANGDGSLRYEPAAGFAEGTDTFSYTLRDAANLTSSAIVAITLSDAFGREWQTFGNGPDHTGRYPASLGTTPLTQRWQYAVGTVVNPLAVADGKVFWTGKGLIGGSLCAVALDAVTGGEAWRKQLPFSNSYPALNPPSHCQGRVYFQRGNQDSDSQVFALDAGTGATLWQSPFSAQWDSYMAPAVNDQGVFVNGGMFGGIYGFDRLTGTQKFFTGLEQNDDWTPTLSGGGVYSFVTGRFRSHDPDTGAILWTLDLGWDWTGYSMYRTVAIEGGLALLVNNKAGGNELVCINLASQSVAWRVQAAFTGTPALTGGIVYALSGGTVKTYGLSAGQWLGDFVAPGETALADAPVVCGDVLVAASGTQTYFFNLATRQVFQTLTFGSQPAIVDGVVYLACSDNTIRAYGRNPAGNQPPVASAAQVNIIEEAQASIQLEATDANGDLLSFVIRSLPASGTLYQTADGTTKGAAITAAPALISNPNGIVIYQGALDVTGNGVGNFSFTAHDPYAASAAATVQVSISPINDPPIAVPDFVAIRPGQVLTGFRPEANDRDVDGDTLTVIAFTQGSSGQVAQAGDGSIQYTPNAGFTSGTDSFTYTIRDAGGLQSTATVTICVSTTLGRDWPTFGAGPEHTGYVPIGLGTAAFTQRWANNLGKVPYQPAIVGGKVYTTLRVYFQDSSVVALDGSSGGELWRTNFPSIGYFNPPSVFGGDVVAQVSNSTSSRIYALNAGTGGQHWSAPFGAQWEEYYAPAIDSTGVYVNGGTFGGLYGFVPATGAQKFFQELDQSDSWTPTLYGNGLYSFVTGRFRSHDKATGAILWTLDLGWNWSGSDMNRTVACADNRAFLVNDSLTVPAGDQELIAIDLGSHAAAWKVQGKFNGTPAVAHQSVFALSQGTVKAYDAATGTLLATYTAPGETALAFQPIVTNDTVIACSTVKTYVFDLKTRTLRQTINFGGVASLAGEMLYLASPDNNLRAFGIPDPLNNPPTANPIAASTAEDTAVTITLTGADADNDPLTFVIASLPSAGTLWQTGDGITPGAPITNTPALVANSQGKVLYVPPLDRNGTTFGNFTYAASDGKSTSIAAAVTMNVTPVNDPPVAFADQRQIEPGQILSPIRERANDFDPDGDPLTIVSFTQPGLGQVVQNSDGTLRYHPPAGATGGSESFTYTIRDPGGLQSSATVTISIVRSVQGLWPTFGNGPDHAGYSPAMLGRTGWVQRWTAQTGSGANQPVVAEGKVFVSSRPSVPTVTALDEKTGVLAWQRTFAAGFSMNPPSYYGGRVYVQRGNHGSDTQLIALNAADGLTAWTSPFSAQWEEYYAPAIDSTGVYVNGGYYGGIYGFVPATGVQKFFQELDQSDSWTPTLHGSGLYSFVTGGFRSHDKASGAILWMLDFGWNWAGSDMNRTVACADNRAYLVNDSIRVPAGDQELICIDLATHAVAWKVQGKFRQTPAINNGQIYVLSANAVQECSATDGRLTATFAAPAGELLTGQPLITEDLVIATSGTKTYVFDRYDQTLVQTFNTGGTIAAADDQLIVADSSGTVTAFAAAPAITFSPAGGSFAHPVNVVLTATESNAIIRYTVDGSAPGLGSPTVVSGQAVLMESSGEIRAIAVNGSVISRIQRAGFTIDTPLGNWRQAYFGSQANTANAAIAYDFDHDGVINLLEFAFGTDPTANTSGTGPLQYAGAFAGGGSIVSTGQPMVMQEPSIDDTGFHAVYVRRKDYVAAGLTYGVEFSSGNLGTWVPSGTVPTVLAENATHQIVSVPFPPLVGGDKACYFRVKVTLSP